MHAWRLSHVHACWWSSVECEREKRGGVEGGGEGKSIVITALPHALPHSSMRRPVTSVQKRKDETKWKWFNLEKAINNFHSPQVPWGTSRTLNIIPPAYIVSRKRSLGGILYFSTWHVHCALEDPDEQAMKDLKAYLDIFNADFHRIVGKKWYSVGSCGFPRDFFCSDIFFSSPSLQS